MAATESGAADGADLSRLKPLLQVRDLRVVLTTHRGAVTAVDGVSFDLDRGETLAIVGASGSGKSQTALAILGLLDANARASGSVRFEGAELLGAPLALLNTVRGARIGIVFQDSMTSLNPHLRIGTQVAETLQRHRGLARRAALAEALRLLDAVRIADAPRRLFQYPHECSGGMRQRIAIAMALACRPDLLIADEPTTALDATVQAQILALLADLRAKLGLALLLISHDFGVVAQLAGRALVMNAGVVVEQGATADVLQRPQHPYTQELLRLRLTLA